MKWIVFTLVLCSAISVSSYGQRKESKKGKEKATETPAKGLVKVTILYPYSEGKTFDMDYYEKSHMPFVAGLLGSNLVKYTIERGIAGGGPNTPAPFMAIGCFYVKSLSEYQAAITPNIEAIRADFPKYTNVAPVIQISEVVR